MLSMMLIQATRHSQIIASSIVLLVLLPTSLFVHDTSGQILKKTHKNSRNSILTNLWHRFNLKSSVTLNSLYSKKQNIVFSNFEPSTSVTDTTSFLVSKRLQQYMVTRTTATNSVKSTAATMNQMSLQLDFITMIQYFTRSLELSNLLQIHDITAASNNENITRRYRREDHNACYKFEEGDPTKNEFYSPDYPEPYPKNISCFKVLEANPGMVLKVEFRDNFELEDQEKCIYDFLEVRDGKYGYSRLIGRFCRAFPFPEITSSARYLWLYFHSDNSIQGNGFRAVWSMIPRPIVKTPESEECLLNVTNLLEYEIKTSEISEQKRIAAELGTELDCIWNITVPEGWKIQMTFPQFHLDKPNECDINYVQIYDKETSMTNNPSLINNFCGSIADLVTSKGSEAYLRFFVTKAAMNSSFEAIMTAVREKESKDKGCNDNEFDCQDACISDQLRCNERPNCRYRFDEDADICKTKNTGLNINSDHVIIILIVFTLLMSGLCFTFIFNCMKKLIRDHRIIQEHIRQSRENRLEELGRKVTPCPMAEPCIEISNNDHCHSSDSQSLEVLSNTKELISPVVINSRDCTKEHSLRLSIDLNDIHQSNNVSNATQERLQESSEEREMCDIECQTRESIFHSGFNFKPSTHTTFTFGLETTNNLNKPSIDFYSSSFYHTHHEKQHPQSNIYYEHHKGNQNTEATSTSLPINVEKNFKNRNSFINQSSDQLGSRISLSYNSSIVPAPPGWSTNDDAYNSDNRYSCQRLPITGHTNMFDSKESQEFKYDDTTEEHTINNKIKLQKSGTTKSFKYLKVLDSQFKTEAVIEVNKKRPFSIESTKSAPDVIATH